MVKDSRVTYRRRHSYNTKSNRINVVKTPGGRLVVQYVTKPSKGPQCGDCKTAIQGVPRLRPIEYKRLPRHQRTVSRAYGGSRCATCVRDRILRAFIIEEQKIVKKVLAEKRRLEKIERKEKQTAAAKLKKANKGKPSAGKGKKPAAAKPAAAKPAAAKPKASK